MRDWEVRVGKDEYELRLYRVLAPKGIANILYEAVVCVPMFHLVEWAGAIHDKHKNSSILEKVWDKLSVCEFHTANFHNRYEDSRTEILTIPISKEQAEALLFSNPRSPFKESGNET